MLLNRKLITLPAIMLFATGCVTTLPPMPPQPNEPIEPVNGFENVDFSVSDNKVIVAPGSKVNVKSKRQAVFANKIEQFVRDAGSEVVDRTQAQRFAEEIKLNESMNDDFATYEGPVAAKFVVIPTVTSDSYTSDYTRESYYTNKKGESVRVDPYCTYRAKASGTIEIRQLPSMKKVLSVSLTGTDISTQDNARSSCDNENMINSGLNKAIGDLLLKGSDNHLTLNKYVGAEGVITGAKRFEDEIYYETNLGRLHGAKEGLAVKVYVEMDGELVAVTEGEMLNADNIFMKKSYVELKTKKGIEIKKGMIIKLSGACTDIFCSMVTTANETQEILNF
jgi:hypothetical protein